MNLAAQIFGILAFLTSVISFQLKKYRDILIVQTLCAACFAIHFGLLAAAGQADALTGAVLNGVCMVRDLVLLFTAKTRTEKGTRILAAVFSLVIIALGILTWHSAASLLFIIAMTLNTVALSIPDPQHVRIFIMISSPFALGYDIINGSIGGIINEVFSFLSALTALLRYRREKKE